jgi:hypothetical protein
MEPNVSLNVSQVVSSEITEAFKQALAGLPGSVSSNIIFLINLGKAIGIAILVYIIFLIIRSISQIRISSRIKSIAKNVEEINSKLDSIVGKKGSEKIKNKKN